MSARRRARRKQVPPNQSWARQDEPKEPEATEREPKARPDSDPFKFTPAPAQDHDIGLGEIFRIINRRKWVILATVVIFLLVAGFALSQVTPRFTGQVRLLIESRGANIVSVESVVAGLSGDKETIRSEAEILRSRALAGRVIDRLELDKDAEFNSALRPPGALERLADRLGFSSDAPSPSGQDQSGRTRARIVNAFLDRLQVSTVKDTRVISVSFTSEQPDKAAQIANMLADEYILMQLEAKFEATQRANTWLSERVSDLREKVETAEAAVEKFREESGLLQGKGETLTSQEIAELNTQLILARSARAEAEARLRQVQNLVDSPAGADTASEVLDSQLIQRLREQQAEVERRVAELSNEYGERHPRMVALRAEEKDLQQKIDAEVSKIVQGLRNEVGIARARAASLSQSLDQLKGRAAEANQDAVKLRALEREAEASRTLLATMLARGKEINSQDDLEVQQADARIISKADLPTKPSFPRIKVVLGLVFLGACGVGMLLVLLLELLDGGFRSGEQIEEATGASSLGFVPRLPIKHGLSPVDYVTKRPKSSLGEAIRTLNWSISLKSPDNPPKTVLVTSALPEEGKTTIAVCLARIQALGGQKTLIIDADTRRPGVHTAMGLPASPGLVDVLSGQKYFSDASYTDEASGARVLPAGTPVPNSPDLLGSEAMGKLLHRHAHSYDLIIIDSPPVMAAADAQILSQRVDATVFVVRWAKTRREVVRLALQRLGSVGGRLAGVLLTMVDVKKHAQYSFGDSGSYYGYLEKYYGE